MGVAGLNPASPRSWNSVGPLIGYMLIQGSVFLLVILGIEYGHLWIGSRGGGESGEEMSREEEGELESDVAAERQRALTVDPDSAPILTNHLTKVYTKRKCCGSVKLKACDRLCIGVKKGECFGLLGTNGAGKTTTFKMLTGKTAISHGDVSFYGASVRREMGRVRQLLGYCPQFDALNGLLSGREQLRFSARIRGIPNKHLDKVVEWGISHMQLTPYGDVPCGKYSGGNKRKLSTAIALIGNPPIVLLDEPTTGMDPAARRFTWDRIAEVVREGRSVVLTSHSMEECEALCSRIGIMCLGSVQHLKSKYGKGYSLTLKMRSMEEVEKVADWIGTTFPTASLKDRHGPMLHYQLPSTHLKLSQVFGSIADAKEIGIEDYSLCQTSLDQVFLHFAESHYKGLAESNPALAHPTLKLDGSPAPPITLTPTTQTRPSTTTTNTTTLPLDDDTPTTNHTPVSV